VNTSSGEKETVDIKGSENLSDCLREGKSEVLSLVKTE